MKKYYNLKKINNNNIKWKDLVIFLSIVFLVFLSNLIIISFAYFSQTTTVTGNISLAEVDFSIAETQQATIKVLPNISVPKTVYIGNYRDLNPKDFKHLTSILIRFKIDVVLENKINAELTNSLQLTSSDDFYFDDNYFYYCGVLDVGEKINLCDSFYFLSSVDNKYQQKQISLQFSVDAVQSQNQAYKEVWPDYPPAWEKTIL